MLVRAKYFLEYHKRFELYVRNCKLEHFSTRNRANSLLPCSYSKGSPFENIARIANTVQVTLWLSIAIPQCHDSSFAVIVNCVTKVTDSLNRSQCLCLYNHYYSHVVNEVIAVIVVWNQKMSHSVTEWQGHLLSCPGQLKRVERGKSFQLYILIFADLMISLLLFEFCEMLQ